MLLHRSADQGNILQGVYRQHGALKLQDVDPRFAMSTNCPWWRRKAFCSAAYPLVVELSWLNAVAIRVTALN